MNLRIKNKKSTGAEEIIKALKLNKIREVFVYPGGTIAAGSWITCSASGTGIAVSSGEYIFGKAITGVASGSVFQMLIQHNGYRG